MKIKCPKCGDYDEKEIIDSLTMCAFCDKMFGEFIDEHKEEDYSLLFDFWKGAK